MERETSLHRTYKYINVMNSMDIIFLQTAVGPYSHYDFL